jgi:hypothetical protein
MTNPLHDALQALDCLVEVDDWPEIDTEITGASIGQADPDVGIMSATVDDYEFCGNVGDETLTQDTDFVLAIAGAIGCSDLTAVGRIVERVNGDLADAMAFDA